RITGSVESRVSVEVAGQRLVLRRDGPPRPSVMLPELIARLPERAEGRVVVGIDLRASELRPTGWAMVKGDFAETKVLKTDAELLDETLACKPVVVSIDAPLTLPKGRCCTADACGCRHRGIVRECERILWKRGVRVYPCLLPSMRKLTERGMRLAHALRQHDVEVIE